MHIESNETGILKVILQKPIPVIIIFQSHNIMLMDQYINDHNAIQSNN